MDNLRGKNTGRIARGTDSSSVPSTILKKLKDLDRRIGILDVTLKTYRLYKVIYPHLEKEIENVRKRRSILDLKRKEVRNQRKYYARNK